MVPVGYTNKSAYFHAENLFKENHPAREKSLHSNMFRIVSFAIKTRT